MKPITQQKRTWQRFILSLAGVILIAAMWRWAVMHLYVLPVATLAAFTTITVNTQYTVSAIIIFMVTGRLIYEWKLNTVSTIEEKGEQVFEIAKEFQTPELKARYGDR